MPKLADNLRKARRVCRAVVGLDISVRRQVVRPTLLLGNKNASWCICPNDLTEASIVYSFGIGEDISFDLALIERFAVRVHAFDPTPRSRMWLQEQTLPPQFVLHDYGVGGYDGYATFFPPQDPKFVSYSMIASHSTTEAGVEVPIRRLRTIMDALGHARIDLLKMDIEGAEYNVISDVVQSRLDVRQLVVEFHHRWPQLGIEKTRRAISELNRYGFRIFHVSPAGTEYSFCR